MKLFLHRLIRRGFSQAQRRHMYRIRDAVEGWVLAKGYTRPLATAEEIAADIGIPADELSRYIRLLSGKPLLTWRKELRILEAQRLLRDYPEMPVSMIGEMVGIEDKSNFRKQFTEVVGMTPRQWREGMLR